MEGEFTCNQTQPAIEFELGDICERWWLQFSGNWVPSKLKVIYFVQRDRTVRLEVGSMKQEFRI